jgi:hypothetical protein
MPSGLGEKPVGIARLGQKRRDSTQLNRDVLYITFLLCPSGSFLRLARSALADKHISHGGIQKQAFIGVQVTQPRPKLPKSCA